MRLMACAACFWRPVNVGGAFVKVVPSKISFAFSSHQIDFILSKVHDNQELILLRPIGDTIPGRGDSPTRFCEHLRPARSMFILASPAVQTQSLNFDTGQVQSLIQSLVFNVWPRDHFVVDDACRGVLPFTWVLASPHREQNRRVGLTTGGAEG